MNDFDYDNLQKKRIARNATAKKNGSKKQCTLPSDYLTPAQKRKLNGEVMTYQITKPVPFAEFKKYPVDVQKQYFEHFAHTHGCTSGMIAEALDTTPGNLQNWLCNRADPVLKGILRKNASKGVKATFRAWLDNERGGGGKPRTECSRSGHSNRRNRGRTETRNKEKAASRTAFRQYLERRHNHNIGTRNGYWADLVPNAPGYQDSCNHFV